MKKGIIVILIIVAIGLTAGGYIYLKSKKTSAGAKALEDAGKAAESITNAATQGVLPELGNTNPLENKPNVNPVDKTNPFKDIKTNPFE